MWQVTTKWINFCKYSNVFLVLFELTFSLEGKGMSLPNLRTIDFLASSNAVNKYVNYAKITCRNRFNPLRPRGGIIVPPLKKRIFWCQIYWPFQKHFQKMSDLVFCHELQHPVCTVIKCKGPISAITWLIFWRWSKTPQIR